MAWAAEMPAAERLQRQQDAGQMRALLEAEAFGCYQRYLHAEIENALARVLDAPLADVEAARGVYRGLRLAQQLPHRVIAHAKEPN